nr:hypothetical protein [uncultured Cellulosilyticum sp.]
MTIHNKLVLGNTGDKITFEQGLILASLMMQNSNKESYTTVRGVHSFALKELYDKEKFNGTILLLSEEGVFKNNVYNQLGNRVTMEEVINFLKENISVESINFQLVKNILVDECIDYFWVLFAREKHVSYQIFCDLEIHKKIEVTMLELIEHFSVAQMYRIIWKHCKRAMDDINQGYIEVGNGIYKAAEDCRKYGQQAINRGWYVRPYNPDSRIVRSSISRICFDEVLGIGNRWFYEPIHKLYVSAVCGDVA